MTPKEKTNDYSESKKFRVPDLRSMFIRYVVPDRIDTRNTSFRSKERSDFSNRVGSWEMDSAKNQEIIINKGLDKHYHFIVLDSNSNFDLPERMSNTKSWNNNKIEFSSAINGEDDWRWPKYNAGAKPLAKFGSMRRPDGYNGVMGPGITIGDNLNTTKGCDTRNCTKIECPHDQRTAFLYISSIKWR